MSINGKWNMVIKTPMGDQKPVLTMRQEGDVLVGHFDGEHGPMELVDGTVEGQKLKWTGKMKKPVPLSLVFEAEMDENGNLSGKCKLGPFGRSNFTGTLV